MKPATITHNKVVEFLNSIYKLNKDFLKSNSTALLAFYRGGLPMTTIMSNILDKPFTICRFQNRDNGDSKIVDEMFSPKPIDTIKLVVDETTDDFIPSVVVFEDIVDSGRTIEALCKYFADKGCLINIQVYALYGNNSTIDKLTTKYDNLSIIYRYEFSGEWVTFPWETLIQKDIVDNQLIKDVQKTFEDCLNTMIAKNHDYTAGSVDPYKNFMNVESLGIVNAETGILVRLSDKLSRLTGLVSKIDMKVKDESINDTIDDAINYLAILKSVIKYKQEIQGDKNV